MRTLDFLDAAQKESAGSDGADLEVLIENVLEELKTRTASAACDRTANSAIEKICLLASFQQTLVLMIRFTPYALFLARNRHSSH